MNIRTIEDVLSAATLHGEQSEPDMEVGDLQQVAYVLWKFVPVSRREEALLQISEQCDFDSLEEEPEE